MKRKNFIKGDPILKKKEMQENKLRNFSNRKQCMDAKTKNINNKKEETQFKKKVA